MASVESRGRQRVRPDLPVPSRPRSRHATAVRAEQVRAQAMGAGTPPRPRSRHRSAVRAEPVRARSGSRNARGPAPYPARPRAQTYDGSPLAGLCAALVSAVVIWLWSNPPPPWYESPQGYRGLAAAVVAALMVLLLLRHPPRVADNEFPDRSSQILATPAPQVQQRQTRLTGSMLDAEQVAAVFRRCSREEATTRPILAASPSRAESSDSDGGGSSSSDDEIRSNVWYTSVQALEAGANHLILPHYGHQLQEMVRGLSEADALDTVRMAFKDIQETDGFLRLSDAIDNQWILHADIETDADPRALIGRSTGTLVKMSVTAKLLQLIWSELDGQSWQLCQEVKKECFREVAGQSVQNLLDVAISFSNARWSGDNTLQMLTIFDAHVDVLYSIRDLPFNRNEFIPSEVADIPDLTANRFKSIHNVAAHIFHKMVVDFRVILVGTTYDMHRRRESTIHRATVILIEYLEFFYRKGEMMQSVLGTGHCTIEVTIINSWVSKLQEDAETMFQEKGQRYIFLMNNIYYVYEVKDRPGGFLSSIELQKRVYSLIQQYKKSYLDTYWVPLARYLDSDFLNKPRLSSLNKFTEEFERIRRRERT
ncbi:unnamed protein product [Alopecurus aequalis]